MSRPALTWRPNPGPQTAFLATAAVEALYGGAAGGGKSDALLMGALRDVAHPAFRGLILRRTFPELQRSLVEKARIWYPLAGGEYAEARKQWRFPSGAVIEFGHVEHESDVYAFASSEYQYLAFDELTTFTEKQYLFLTSRVRSAAGLQVCIRSATNPGGEGHDWVFRRWAPWLDRSPTYTGLRASSGQVLHYRNSEDGERWCEAGAGALSRVFIPAKVQDNPHLMAGDPGYVERLSGLDAVTRARLRDGDWLAAPAAGLYFKRDHFQIIDIPPRLSELRCVRYWDRAASEGKGDYTAGVLLGRDPRGVFFVLDVVRLRGSPGQVQETILHTAELDGRVVMVGIEEDPGQAGKFEAASYVRALAGYNVRTFRPTGSKVTRAQPASAQAEHGNVKLVRAPWNHAFLAELEAFPEGGHDDQVDALSGAVAAIAQEQVARYDEWLDVGRGSRRLQQGGFWTELGRRGGGDR